jgi:ABC-type phosphate/phosphonate transport system substrate-binding protein
MAKFWVVWIIMPWMLWATEAPLRFGAIATVSPKELEKRFEPLLHHLEAATGRRIVFESAPTYDRTIENFVEGRYDFGWIGPSPYILATRKKPGSLRILGALAGPEGGDV